MTGPPLDELLDTRGLMTELRLPRHAAEKIMRDPRVPKVRPDLWRRVYVRRHDVEALVTAWLTHDPERRETCALGSVHIRTTKTTKGEPRYVVRYRVGGRESRTRHAGSFHTMAEARARRNLVAGELAEGRDPATRLAAVKRAHAARRTVAEWADAFTTSRVDVADKTLRAYGNAKGKLGKLGRLDAEDVVAADVQDWVAANAALAPASIRMYLSVVRQILDYAGVDPNPARSRQVKLPAADRSEPVPPSGEEWRKIRGRLAKQWRLAVRLLEATGLRVGELAALTWGDVDFDAGRFRVSRSRTKGRTAGQRWLPVPPALLDEVADLKAYDDRGRERRVFPGLETGMPIRHALSSACKAAGTAHYHPHDLRHRRVSLWFAVGIDAVTVAAWAGHAKPSMSSDVYGHVLVSGDDEWAGFWLDAYANYRKPVAVRARTAERAVGATDG